jgi:hypothetical protein
MADITDADTDIEAIRLINGEDNTNSGRLELLYNGTWGTVCDRLWSSSEAKVACRSVMPLHAPKCYNAVGSLFIIINLYQDDRIR